MITIPIEILNFKHLSDISYYNNNYYECILDVEGQPTIIIYEQCEEEYNFYSYYIGYFKDNNFISLAPLAESRQSFFN